jgi:hypothetical protein
VLLDRLDCGHAQQVSLSVSVLSVRPWTSDRGRTSVALQRVEKHFLGHAPQFGLGLVTPCSARHDRLALEQRRRAVEHEDGLDVERQQPDDAPARGGRRRRSVSSDSHEGGG